MCERASMPQCMEGEFNLLESDLSYSVAPSDPTHVVRLPGRYFLPAEPSCNTEFYSCSQVTNKDSLLSR